jgi:membrane protease YdiL (CAAX protease family)
VIALCVVAVAGAQAVTAFVDPMAGAVMGAVLLVVLLNHRLLLLQQRRTPAALRTAAAFAALALVQLLSLLSLVLALDSAGARAYAIVGAPALVATVLTAVAVAPRITLRYWAGAHPWRQTVVAACGIPLGLAGFALLEPAPLSGSRSAGALLAAGVVVFLVAGVLEEVVFRGLLQRALALAVGDVPGTIAAAALFAAVYLGTRSAAAVAFFGAFGAVAAWWIRRTGDLAGVAAAHGLLAAGLVVVWPVLL